MDIFLDFETRSRADLKKCGSYCYAADPSTTLLCLAIARGGEEIVSWHPGQRLPAVLVNAVQATVRGEQVTWHAHNAGFERVIWRDVFAKQFKLPDIPLANWACTAARCAAAGLPRGLENVSEALGLGQNKDKEGRFTLLKYTKPTPKGEFLSDPSDYALISRYCRQDVELERMVHYKTPELSESEQLVWRLDQVINDRGVPIDFEFVRSCVRQLKEYAIRLNAELSDITGGAVTAATQLKKLVEWLNSRGLDLTGVTAGTNDMLRRRDDLDADVMRALEIRATLSKSSTAKFEKILSQSGVDKRIRGCHMYWGGHTGRFAGRGVQTQNLPRGEIKAEDIPDLMKLVTGDHALELTERIYGDPVSVLSGLIRPAIKAKPGKVFVPCDFAQVEARGLAWLAGAARLLEAFETGQDAYKLLAAEIYDKHVGDVTKVERHLGKTAILGLGYGMGSSKFQETCFNQRPPIEISEDFAKMVVERYRETYPEIPDLWGALNAAAMECVETGFDKRVGRITFNLLDYRGSRWLRCILPSGRAISYYGPFIALAETSWGKRIPQLHYWAEDSQTHQWKRTTTYGGKLAENVVQGLCRDLLVEAMFRSERAGLPVVMHVHDEFVPEVDVAEPVELVKRVEAIAQVRPGWAKGFPIGAEAFVSDRYRK